MKQIKWFDRKFNFADNQNVFPSIIERLSRTPLRLNDKISRIPVEHFTIKIDSSWSILENFGHLIDLEQLWQGRLEDILNNCKELRPADLQNRKTDLANHNNREVESLLKEFLEIRNETLKKLEALPEEDIFKSALHPRLKTPMRTMDLFLFVAEHDDHHLGRITEINKMLSQSKNI